MATRARTTAAGRVLLITHPATTAETDIGVMRIKEAIPTTLRIMEIMTGRGVEGPRVPAEAAAAGQAVREAADKVRIGETAHLENLSSGADN